MKIITIIVLSALALAAAALLSSGCADSLIMGDDFGIGEFTGCSYDAFQGWSESVESDGYVHTIKNILVDAKDKATYLLPDSADESKILSLICGSMRIEFSMPMMNYGIITVENAIDGGFAQPLEYKIDVSDFDVTIEGLRAASLLMSQKSVPAKQFNLDEIIESNMYKKTSSVESLRRRGGSKFHVAYDQDGYSIGLLGITRGRCILVGFILLERFASKSGSKYGKTLARFRAGAHIG